MTRSPSFHGRVPASANASLVKTRNKRTGTLHERVLFRALSKLAIRFERHVSGLPGCPDIVFRRERIAVFCDGDFWHGRNWRQLRLALCRRWNAGYWVAKISSNRIRDARVTRELSRAGWTVIRLWETDIKHDPQYAARTILRALARHEVQVRPALLQQKVRPRPSVRSDRFRSSLSGLI
jgi:DNA mismatch endonuclease, patch repair protein